MTIENFTKMITYIRKAYNNDFFLNDPETQEIWYKFFEKLDADAVKRSVDDHIRSSNKLPTIADIMDRYEYWIEHIRFVKQEIAYCYESTFLYTPFDESKDNHGLFFSELNRYKTLDEKAEAARYFRDHVKEYYKEHSGEEGLSFSSVLNGLLKRYDERRVQKGHNSV